MIIDTHCHLDSSKYQNDLNDVLRRGEENGVKYFIIPAADPKDLKKAISICEKYENIYFAVGIHPYHAHEWRDDIFQFVNHSKCVAIGECGLDYFRLPKDSKKKELEIKRQKDVFIKQIHLAKKFKKPLIVHIRDASQDSKEILLQESNDEVKGVLHCFNADKILLELANFGFYFGIGGVVTFKNSKKLVEIVPEIALDKILIETDSPYLTPHPHRGTRNEPAYTKLVVEKLGEIKNISQEIIETTTTQNAFKLFNLKEKV
jgi:TatD DNase family protein